MDVVLLSQTRGGRFLTTGQDPADTTITASQYHIVNRGQVFDMEFAPGAPPFGSMMQHGATVTFRPVERTRFLRADPGGVLSGVPTITATGNGAAGPDRRFHLIKPDPTGDPAIRNGDAVAIGNGAALMAARLGRPVPGAAYWSNAAGPIGFRRLGRFREGDTFRIFEVPTITGFDVPVSVTLPFDGGGWLRRQFVTAVVTFSVDTPFRGLPLGLEPGQPDDPVTLLGPQRAAAASSSTTMRLELYGSPGACGRDLTLELWSAVAPIDPVLLEPDEISSGQPLIRRTLSVTEASSSSVLELECAPSIDLPGGWNWGFPCTTMAYVSVKATPRRGQSRMNIDFSAQRIDGNPANFVTFEPAAIQGLGPGGRYPVEVRIHAGVLDNVAVGAELKVRITVHAIPTNRPSASRLEKSACLKMVRLG